MPTALELITNYRFKIDLVILLIYALIKLKKMICQNWLAMSEAMACATSPA